MAGPRRARRGVRRRFPPAAVHRRRLGERGRAARPARRPRPDAAGRPSRHPGVPGRRRRAAAAGCVGGPRARPHRLLLRSRAASRVSPRRSASCGPAGRSRSSTSTPPCPRTAAWMRADLPRYDPAAAEAFFTDRGFTLRRIPTVWRFPDRATRDAVLRIEFSRTSPSARSPPPTGWRSRWATGCTCAAGQLDRPGSDVVEPPAARRARAGTVGGPGRRRWDGSCAGRSKFRDRRYWPSRGVPPGWRARRPCPAERARWCSPPASRSPCG